MFSKYVSVNAVMAQTFLPGVRNGNTGVSRRGSNELDKPYFCQNLLEIDPLR